MKTYGLLIAGLALSCFLAIGCGDTTKTEPAGGGGTNTKTDNHDDHDHAHVHGPNNGHVFEFEPHEFHGEWKQYNDNNKIRIYVLDEAGKKNVAVKAESISVIPRVGSDKTPFVLPAENPNEAGESAVFVMDDVKLKTAIPLGVDIELKVGDKTYKGEIKAHEPMDH